MSNERSPELIQEYLADRLSAADRAAFERRLETDETLVRDVEISLRFREGLAHLRDQGELQDLIRPRRRPYRALLAAAAILLVTVIAYLAYPFRRPPVIVAGSLSALPAPAKTPLAVAASYSFAVMRSATEVPRIPLPPAGALELKVLTASGGHDAFRVELDTLSPEHRPLPMGAVKDVVPDADGFVTVYVNASRLTPGDYVIVAESRAAGASAQEQFEFQLQRPDGTRPDRR